MVFQGWRLQQEHVVSYKVVMVHVQLGTSNARLLKIAGDLVERFQADVIGIAACRPIQIPFDDVSLTGEVIAEDREEIEKELKAARELVSAGTVDFRPERYHDEHLKALRKLLEKKAAQHRVVKPPAEREKKGAKKTAKALDLMAALEASLAAAKTGAAGEADAPHRRRRKSA